MALMTEVTKTNVTPANTIRNMESVGGKYKETLIAESSAEFDSKWSQKYPKLGGLLESEDQRDQMRAALTVRMVEQTQTWLDHLNHINEAVTQQSLGRLNRRVLDVVRIFYPNLIAHELVDIQTLDGQVGEIFTVQPRFNDPADPTWYDADGNAVDTPEIFKVRRSNDGAGTGWDYSATGEGSGGGDRDMSHTLNYATSATPAVISYGALPGETGAANRVPVNTDSVSSDTDYLPILPGSFRLLIGTAYDLMDNGSGALQETTGATAGNTNFSHGFVNYTTGNVRVDLSSGTISAGLAVSATFRTGGEREIDSDMVGGAVNANVLPRRVEIGIAQQTVKAQMYPLQVDWSVGASLAAKAHLNLDVNDTVSELAAHYIKWERDNLLTLAIRNSVTFPANIPAIYNATPLKFSGTATDSPGADTVAMAANKLTASRQVVFDCGPAVTGTNQAEFARRDRFADFEITIDEAESQLQRKNGRGRIDWILCGNRVANVIRQVQGFVPAMVGAPIGAHVIGHLRDGTIAIIKDINMHPDLFVCGYRGYMAGDSAIILAEWIPIYLTPPQQSATLTTSQGIMSAYDLVPNHTDYLIAGAIGGYNV